ncbi:MAG: ATP-binding protein [Planctomycetota bacterium]
MSDAAIDGAGRPAKDGAAGNSPAAGDGDTQRLLREDPGQAALRLERRLARGDVDGRTWHNLAVARANLGDVSGALAAVDAGLALTPGAVATRFLRGKILQGADHYAEALVAYDDVAQSDPNHPGLLANRGVVRFFTGDHAGAVQDFEAAVQRDPGDASTLFNLAVAYVATRSFHRAEWALGRLIALEPERAQYYYQFFVELGRLQVLHETSHQNHRLKNFMGIVGDRLRRVCESDLSHLEPELREDLLGVRDDYQRIYGDLVIFLRAIQQRPMRLQLVDLRRMIERVVFVAIERGGKVTVRREFPEHLPEIRCDLDMLQEALLNLLINALDAIEAAPHDAGLVIIRVEAERNDVVVTFVDDGCGIPPGDLGRIFEFGFTTKSLGTGIGLAFTRRVLEQHGGSMTVESAQGQGTTIRCVLPMAPRLSETLTNLAFRGGLSRDLRELILEEPGGDLGI